MMTNRLASLVIATLLGICCAGNAVAGYRYYWHYAVIPHTDRGGNKTGTATITGYEWTMGEPTGTDLDYYEPTPENLVIPRVVTVPNDRSYLITVVGWAGWGEAGAKTNLVSVVIPDSVVEISGLVFAGMEKLQSVQIPNSVTNIGNYAFMNSALASVTIPESVETIQFCAFAGCDKLSQVTIKGATRIEKAAFKSCTKLTHLDLGKQITEIKDEAFSGCVRLRSVSLPGSVWRVEDLAFYGCSGLSSVEIDGANLTLGRLGALGSGGVFGFCSGLKTVTLKKGVVCVGGKAFQNCTNLTTVTVEPGIKRIDDSAFSYCRKLESIELPDTLTSVGESAFWGCDNLRTAILSGNHAVVERGAFASCGRLSSLTVKKGVDRIGSSVFSSCTNLSSVIIENGVRDLGDEAFASCRRLSAVSIPGSVTNLGFKAFASCTNLTSVTLQEGLVTIGDQAFASCSKLRAIAIPGSVTDLYRTFAGCSSLERVVFKGNAPRYDPALYVSIPYSLVWYVPEGSTGWAGEGSPVIPETWQGRKIVTYRSGENPLAVILTFNGNGGTSGVSSKAYTIGSEYKTVPTATRTGYTFAGWWTAASGGTLVTAATLVPSVNTTLYAHWRANTYTVKFNANGGSGVMSAQTMTYDTAKALAANAFIRAGSVFAGWSRTAGGAVAFADKAVVRNLASAQGATVNLYAVWKESPIQTSRLDGVASGGALASGGSKSMKLTYDGFVMDAGSVTGTLSLTVTGTMEKPKLAAKGVTAGGNLSFKGISWQKNANGTYTATLTAKGSPLSLTIGEDVAKGRLGAGTVYLARNRAAEKNTSAVVPFVGDYTAAMEGETVAGYLQLAIKAAKGAVTVKGALADGTTISAKATALDFGVADGALCVPVFAVKKGKFVFGALLWVTTDHTIEDDAGCPAYWEVQGHRETLDLAGSRIVSSGLSGKRTILFDAVPNYYDGTSGIWRPAVARAVPHGLTVTFANGVVSVGATTKPVKNSDGSYSYNGPLDSAIKLKSNAKTGLLSGSFKLYYDWTDKAKKNQHKVVTAKVTGVAVGKSFVGFATVPQSNPALKKTQKIVPFTFTIE